MRNHKIKKIIGFSMGIIIKKVYVEISHYEKNFVLFLNLL